MNLTHQNTPKWALGTSYLFHPLFMPLYGILFLSLRHPFLWNGYRAQYLWILSFLFLFNAVLVPALLARILVKAGWTPDLHFKERKSRTHLYIITSVMYALVLFLAQKVMVPHSIRIFLEGALFVSLFYFLINFRIKLSIHTGAAGALSGLCMASLKYSPSVAGWIWVVFSVLLAGFIASARVVAGSHTRLELYGGYLLGLLVMSLLYGLL